MPERPHQLLRWRDDYLIGVEELDYEHKDLFDKLNALQLELAADMNADNMQRILEEIYTRLVTHFALEEFYMHEHAYARTAEHKREHEAFLERMRETIGRFQTTTDAEELDLLFTGLTEWVIHHVLHSDKQLSAVEATA